MEGIEKWLAGALARRLVVVLMGAALALALGVPFVREALGPDRVACLELVDRRPVNSGLSSKSGSPVPAPSTVPRSLVSD